jgi:ABC-type transport system involved in cytochrome bd biosynthesis fused ATPase/permease subunit
MLTEWFIYWFHWTSATVIITTTIEELLAMILMQMKREQATVLQIGMPVI